MRTPALESYFLGEKERAEDGKTETWADRKEQTVPLWVLLIASVSILPPYTIHHHNTVP
jgi:hypothetical protein